MSRHTRLRLVALGAVIAAVLAGPATHAAGAAARPSFTWAGVFDLVGSGFPDGDRRAVMHIARSDSAYTLVSLQGPPGTLVHFRVSGDSAHVTWNLGRDVMVVDLRGSDDTLSGEWSSDEGAGPVWGIRRR